MEWALSVGKTEKIDETMIQKKVIMWFYFEMVEDGKPFKKSRVRWYYRKWTV